MSTANWYPDPTGRYAQRYFDGQQWTSHVAGRDGTQSQDPTPIDPAIPAPGAAPAPPPPTAAAPPPAAATHAPPSAASPSPSAAPASGSTVIGPGLILSGIGALLTLLAMFAFDWLSDGPFALDRSEIADLIDAFSGFGGETDLSFLTEAFFNFGWIVVLLAAIAALAAPFVPALKVPVAIVCFIGAAWVLFAAVDVGDGMSDLAIGTYLGVGGPALAAVGALISQPARN